MEMIGNTARKVAKLTAILGALLPSIYCYKTLVLDGSAGAYSVDFPGSIGGTFFQLYAGRGAALCSDTAGHAGADRPSTGCDLEVLIHEAERPIAKSKASITNIQGEMDGLDSLSATLADNGVSSSFDARLHRTDVETIHGLRGSGLFICMSERSEYRSDNATLNMSIETSS